MALLEDGTLRAWGNNSEGQTTIPPDLEPVQAIAAGSGHTVALLSNGSVRAWGWNYSGQATIPSDLESIQAIAAGENHTIALTINGVARAWGQNRQGQVSVPTDLGPVHTIGSGDSHTMALSSPPFSIDPETGVVTTSRPLNNESPHYDLRILASDGVNISTNNFMIAIFNHLREIHLLRPTSRFWEHLQLGRASRSENEMDIFENLSKNQSNTFSLVPSGGG